LRVTGVGAYQLVVETVLPDRGIELHSSYTGHPQIAESRVVHLELAPGRHSIRSEELRAGEVPVARARRRCLLDHLAALVDLLGELGWAGVAVEVADELIVGVESP
jgi:hypothetical protein